MIQFAFAGFLAGVAAIAVPIILHLLRKRPVDERPFPSFWFLRDTLAKRHKNNNLRRWIVLLLRCAALAALAAAFAMPYLADFAAHPDIATVLLWDDSFSMSSKTHAKKVESLAAGITAKTRPSQPLQIGVVSQKIKWSGKFFSSPGEARHWLSTNTATNGASSFEGALRQADAKLRAIRAKRKRITIVTDNHALPWLNVKMDTPLSPGVELEIVTPEKIKPCNVAVSAARLASPLVVGAQAVELKVDLDNFSPQTFAGDMAVTIDGVAIDRRQVELPPDSKSTVDVLAPLAAVAPNETVRPKAGLIEFAVDDDIELDNRLHFAINPEPPSTILATKPATGEMDYLDAAVNPVPARATAKLEPLDDAVPLETMKKARLLVARSDALITPQLGDKLNQAMNEGAKLLVLLDQRNQSLDKFLRPHGFSTRAVKERGMIRLGSIDFEHPIFKKFADVRIGSFFDVLFFSPPLTKPPVEAAIPAAFSDGSPAFIELGVGDGRLFVLCTPLDRRRTAWVGHATFLPFVRELMAYCRAGEDRIADQTPVLGQPARIEGLLKVKALADGVETQCVDNLFLPEKQGVYLASLNGGGEMLLAVNSPSGESNPALVRDGFNASGLVSKEKPTEAALASPLPSLPIHGKGLWLFLLAVALACFLGELLVANRSAI